MCINLFIFVAPPALCWCSLAESERATREGISSFDGDTK